MQSYKASLARSPMVARFHLSILLNLKSLFSLTIDREINSIKEGLCVLFFNAGSLLVKLLSVSDPRALIKELF